MPRPSPSQLTRQALETVAILALAGIVHELWRNGVMSPRGVCWLVAGLALVKTAFFFAENLQHILLATAHEIPYHRFLGLMGVNMAQITISFALDFFLLSDFISLKDSLRRGHAAAPPPDHPAA